MDEKATKEGIKYFHAMPQAFTNADLNAMVVTGMIEDKDLFRIISLERLAEKIHELVESGQTSWEKLGFNANDVNERLGIKISG